MSSSVRGRRRSLAQSLLRCSGGITRRRGVRRRRRDERIACVRAEDNRIPDWIKLDARAEIKGGERLPLSPPYCAAQSALISFQNSPLRHVRLRLQTQSSSPPSLSLSQFAVQTARTKAPPQQRQVHPIPLPGPGPPADVANQCFPPPPPPSINEVPLGYIPLNWGRLFARSHGATLLRSGDPQGVCNAIVHAGRGEGCCRMLSRESSRRVHQLPA